MSTYIIAEAGVNHNGSLDRAKKLVDVAADAGADAVKFQTFTAERVLSRHAEKAEYQKKTTGEAGTQLDMVKELELDVGAHRQLVMRCRERGIQFLSTPFDLESVDLLIDELDVQRLKIGSGEITNGPLLLRVAQTGRPTILSTGMSTLGEVERALSVLAFGYTDMGDEVPSLSTFAAALASDEGRRTLRERVTLLHCVTEYPTPYDQVNLRAMDTLDAAFGLPVGFSDHTLGITVPIAAVARGATIVEKHFTLDRTLEGPDHAASLEPGELESMVSGIRQIEQALGHAWKAPMPCERGNRAVARKSLVAARPVEQGERFTEENLTAKRPGGGISPMRYWKWLGESAEKPFSKDDLIR